MSDTIRGNPLSFRAHFIRIHGPEEDPTIRVLLVELGGEKKVYEAVGIWSQCRRWITQMSECAIVGNHFAAIEKRLKVKRLATIKEVQVSIYDLESIGFLRADC